MICWKDLMKHKKKILTEELINYSLIISYVQNLEQNYLDLFVKILKRDETKTKDVEKLFPEKTETIEEILTSLGRQSGTRELLIVTKESISAKIPKVKALVKKMRSYLALLDAMGKIQKQINSQKKSDQDSPAIGLIKTITQLFENDQGQPDLTAVEQKVLEFFENEANKEKLEKLKNIGSPLEDASEALALFSEEGAQGLAKEIKIISAYMDHGAKLKNTIKLRLSDDVADIEDAEPETPEEFVDSLDLDEEGKATLNAFKDFAKTYKPDLQEADDDPTTLLSKFGISQSLYGAFIQQSGADKESFLRILQSLDDKGKAPKFKKFIVTPQESTEDSKKASPGIIKNFLNLAIEQIKLIQQDPPLIISFEEGEDLDKTTKTEIDRIYLEGNQFFQSVQDNEELMQVLLLLNSNNTKKLNQNLLKTSESKVREYYATIKDLYKEKFKEQKTDLGRLAGYYDELDSKEHVDAPKEIPKSSEGLAPAGSVVAYLQTFTGTQTELEETATAYLFYYKWIKENKPALVKFFTTEAEPTTPPTEEPEEEEESQPDDNDSFFAELNDSLEGGSKLNSADIEALKLLQSALTNMLQENSEKEVSDILSLIGQKITNHDQLKAIKIALNKLASNEEVLQSFKTRLGIKAPDWSDDSEEDPDWNAPSEEFTIDFFEETIDVALEEESEEEIEAAVAEIQPENSKVDEETEEVIKDNVVTVVTTLSSYFDFLKNYIKGSTKTTQQEGVANKLLRVMGGDGLFHEFFKQLAKYLESKPDHQKVAKLIKKKYQASLQNAQDFEEPSLVDILKDLWLDGNFAEEQEKKKVIDAYKIPIFSKSKITGWIIKEKFYDNFGAYMGRKSPFDRMIKDFTSAKDSPSNYGSYFFKHARERNDSGKATAHPHKFLNNLYKEITKLKNDAGFTELSPEEKKEIQTGIDKLVADAKKIKDEGLQHKEDKEIDLITPVKVFEEPLQEQIIKLIKPYLLKRMKTKRIGATK